MIDDLNIFMTGKGREDKHLLETLCLALFQLCYSRVFPKNSGRPTITLYGRPSDQADQPSIL